MPGLLRLHVWSDGQQSQYKGEKNFRRIPAWPKSVGAGGMQLQVCHYMYESHHASGPQDNAGKDPRRTMDAAIQHEKSVTIHDYHRCMEWTTKHMARPQALSTHTTVRGVATGNTFGAPSQTGWTRIKLSTPTLATQFASGTSSRDPARSTASAPGRASTTHRPTSFSAPSCRASAPSAANHHIECGNLECTTAW